MIFTIKHFKQAVAGVMAGVLVLSASVPVFAAELDTPDSYTEIVEVVEADSPETPIEVIEEAPQPVEVEKAELPQVQPPKPAKKNLKAATFSTQSVIQIEAEESRLPCDSLTEPAPAVSTSEVTSNSANPDLTMTKEQSVNGDEKTAAKVKAKAGDTITFYIIVSNSESSSASAKSITIADHIPNGMIYVENSATAGASISGDTIRWNVDDLAAGQSISVTYQVQIPKDAKATTYTSTANASCRIESIEESPKTADENHPAVWLTMAGVSLAAMLAGAAELFRLKKHGE